MREALCNNHISCTPLSFATSSQYPLLHLNLSHILLFSKLFHLIVVLKYIPKLNANTSLLKVFPSLPPKTNMAWVPTTAEWPDLGEGRVPCEGIGFHLGCLRSTWSSSTCSTFLLLGICTSLVLEGIFISSSFTRANWSN